MSQFVTPLNSIVQQALGKLPKGASIEEVRLTPDKKGVEVVWKHDDFKTGYLTPFAWTEEQLASQTLPAGVKMVQRVEKPQEAVPPVVTPVTLKVDKKPVKSVKSKQ